MTNLNKKIKILKYNHALSNAIKSISNSVMILSENEDLIRIMVKKDKNLVTKLGNIVEDIASLQLK